jgi:hypothetical protein
MEQQTNLSKYNNTNDRKERQKYTFSENFLLSKFTLDSEMKEIPFNQRDDSEDGEKESKKPKTMTPNKIFTSSS